MPCLYYLYDERNRLTQKSVKSNTAKSPTNPDSLEADITTYEYDLQGSLLKEEVTDFCKQYLYNDFHQCIQTDVIRGREESAERLVQENLYDGEGLRFAIIENGKRTGFITDGWNNVAEIDENGRVTKRIIRGMGIVASEDTEQKEDNIFTTAYHYYHGNERMDVEYITDESGNVVNSYTYDAFGGIISSNETIQNRYTYNGEAYDKITEQYYLRKRYYNPKLCRFTQEDEYRGDGLNLYAFCANNPVMYVDPSGYSSNDTQEILNSWNRFQSENSDKNYSNAEMSDAYSNYKKENGIGDHYLERPYIKKSIRDNIPGKIEDNLYFDSNLQEVFEGPAHIGHTNGNEFWRCRDAAEALGFSPSEFSEYFNDPKNTEKLFQYEKPKSNESHEFEDKNPDISKKKDEMDNWRKKKNEEDSCGGTKCKIQ